MMEHISNSPNAATKKSVSLLAKKNGVLSQSTNFEQLKNDRNFRSTARGS